MTLQQLRYVIMIAETGTITEAANRLYISQPSLTNAIHELEKEMNITIFNRSNKGISLSKEGDDFVGSFLRPQALKDAKTDAPAGRSYPIFVTLSLRVECSLKRSHSILVLRPQI